MMSGLLNENICSFGPIINESNENYSIGHEIVLPALRPVTGYIISEIVTVQTTEQ